MKTRATLAAHYIGGSGRQSKSFHLLSALRGLWPSARQRCWSAIPGILARGRLSLCSKAWVPEAGLLPASISVSNPGLLRWSPTSLLIFQVVTAAFPRDPLFSFLSGSVVDP